MILVSCEYNNEYNYTNGQFQDFILQHSVYELIVQNDKNFERIMIIFFILIGKYIYIDVDIQNMKISIIEKNYFEFINVSNILEDFLFSVSLNENQIFLVNIILNEYSIQEIFNLDKFATLQQENFFHISLSPSVVFINIKVFLKERV